MSSYYKPELRYRERNTCRASEMYYGEFRLITQNNDIFIWIETKEGVSRHFTSCRLMNAVYCGSPLSKAVISDKNPADIICTVDLQFLWLQRFLSFFYRQSKNLCDNRLCRTGHHYVVQFQLPAEKFTNFLKSHFTASIMRITLMELFFSICNLCTNCKRLFESLSLSLVLLLLLMMLLDEEKLDRML